MLNFTLCNPTKIVFGKGQIAKLGELIPAGSKILLTYGQSSIKKNGVYDQVLAALKKHKIFEFDGIEANPKFEHLLTAVPIIRQNEIDFILAVGGGSVIDGTKFIAAAAYFEGDPWEIITKKPSPINRAVPFGCVLTLPATGSEMNCGSVISRKNSPDKLAFRHDLVYPKFSILDPAVTYTLPSVQTANGIIDTFVHVTEQYITYPVNASIQDRFAEGILLTLIDEAPKVVANQSDYDVRANLMWAATWGLNDFIGVGVPNDWATHILGHELTACFGLDHAVTLAIVLPALLDYKREQKKQKLLQYAERVWQITSGTEEEKITLAIEKTRGFFEWLGVKTRLRDYNIDKSQISRLIQQLRQHGNIAIGENQDIDLKQSEEIYLRCL